MKNEPNDKKVGQASMYAGSGLAIGVGLGSFWGLLLFNELAIGAGIGAAIGLLIGASIDAQRSKG
jgi:hypothetical protein